jgi:hypothetical protein
MMGGFMGAMFIGGHKDLKAYMTVFAIKSPRNPHKPF